MTTQQDVVKMELKIFVLLFGVFLITPFISAVAINNGTVFNTTSSNSSVTFSFNINASNFTIENNYILLYGINFTNSTGTYTCDDVNHSTANSNLDSSGFTCTLQTTSSDNEDTSTSSGSGGGFWTGVRENENLEEKELKLTIGVNEDSSLNKEIKSDLTGIKRIKVVSKERIYGNIAIKPLESMPEECNIEYDETYSLYELVDIREDFNASEIENITLQWAIDNLWMQENNVSHIKVVKCYPKYEVLKTEKVNQTENKTYYDVHSDSFSTWAVLGIENFDEVPKESSGELFSLDDKLRLENWIYLVLGISLIFILFFAFLLLRKKKRRKKRS
jgi:PGF-pre-PGF domain-containing protein